MTAEETVLNASQTKHTCANTIPILSLTGSCCLPQVKYTADPVDGYIAQVTYEGEAQHPEVYGGPVVYQPVHAPQYSY